MFTIAKLDYSAIADSSVSAVAAALVAIGSIVWRTVAALDLERLTFLRTRYFEGGGMISNSIVPFGRKIRTLGPVDARESVSDRNIE
jgi:hypothetical protein